MEDGERGERQREGGSDGLAAGSNCLHMARKGLCTHIVTHINQHHLRTYLDEFCSPLVCVCVCVCVCVWVQLHARIAGEKKSMRPAGDRGRGACFTGCCRLMLLVARNIPGVLPLFPPTTPPPPRSLSISVPVIYHLSGYISRCRFVRSYTHAYVRTYVCRADGRGRIKGHSRSPPPGKVRFVEYQTRGRSCAVGAAPLARCFCCVQTDRLVK